MNAKYSAVKHCESQLIECGIKMYNTLKTTNDYGEFSPGFDFINLTIEQICWKYMAKYPLIDDEV